MVKYVEREYVSLTDEGEQAARRVLARHDLLTRFFSEVLQMPSAANVELSESLELVSQVYFEIPGADEPWAVGMMIGYSATLSSAR